MLLDNLRVLDLTRLAPGPFCTLALADMGADVLKIEDLGAGDYMRTLRNIHIRDSIAFLMLNRNKRSMTLNLKTDSGKEILKRLIMSYDVLVEQFRPGTMERMGLGYETLREINPRLIFCSITGYGQTGPLRNVVGHDVNYLANSGVLDSISREGEAPVIPGIYLGDMAAGGLWALSGILAAVNKRNATGKGEYIDVSMYDGLVSLMNLYADDYLMRNSRPPKRVEAFYNVFRTADNRYITIAAAEPKFWAVFCQAIGMPGLIPRLGDDETGQRQMIEELSALFAQKTQAEWTELLGPLAAMYAPVLSIDEVFASPHFKARDMEWNMTHPVEGKVRSIGFPIKYRENPAAVRFCAPAQGEHTLEVLKELNLSDEVIQRLQNENVISVYKE